MVCKFPKFSLLIAVWLVNAPTFKTQEITDILKHDTSFAVCLFAAANGAFFQQLWKIRVNVGVRFSVWVTASCRISQ